MQSRGTAALAVIGLVALALASLGPLPAATAGTDHCVTRAEFRQVHKGLTQDAVDRVFDTHGKMGSGGAGGYTRNYRECGTHRTVTVTYVVGMSRHRPPTLFTKRWNSTSRNGTVQTASV